MVHCRGRPAGGSEQGASYLSSLGISAVEFGKGGVRKGFPDEEGVMMGVGARGRVAGGLQPGVYTV